MSLAEVGGQGHRDAWGWRRALAVTRTKPFNREGGLRPSKYRCLPWVAPERAPKSGRHPVPEECLRGTPEGQEAGTDHEQTERRVKSLRCRRRPFGLSGTIV